MIAGATNDGRTMIIVYWPVKAFPEVRTDIEGNFLAALDLAPGLAERVRNGTRAEHFRGTADLPNFYRRPHGPGWALVGDAGYHKDPITARASPTPSATPNCWPRRSTTAWPADAP